MAKFATGRLFGEVGRMSTVRPAGGCVLKYGRCGSAKVPIGAPKVYTAFRPSPLFPSEKDREGIKERKKEKKRGKKKEEEWGRRERKALRS